MQHKEYEVLNPLKRIRVIHCLTMDDMSEQTGLSKNTIFLLEHGKSKQLRMSTLKKLKECYNVDPLEFREEYLQWREQCINN